MSNKNFELNAVEDIIINFPFNSPETTSQTINKINNIYTAMSYDFTCNEVLFNTLLCGYSQKIFYQQLGIITKLYLVQSLPYWGSIGNKFLTKLELLTGRKFYTINSRFYIELFFDEKYGYKDAYLFSAINLLLRRSLPNKIFWNKLKDIEFHSENIFDIAYQDGNYLLKNLFFPVIDETNSSYYSKNLYNSELFFVFYICYSHFYFEKDFLEFRHDGGILEVFNHYAPEILESFICEDFDTDFSENLLPLFYREDNVDKFKQILKEKNSERI